MLVHAHLTKWKRFARVRDRLDPREDFELWYWATLSGGTALINAALHCAGITEANDLYVTQIEGVYARLDGLTGWHPVLGYGCDLIHVGLPKLDQQLPFDLQAAFDAMEVIERYRDPCVRNNEVITDAIITTCEHAYHTVVQSIGETMEEEQL